MVLTYDSRESSTYLNQINNRIVANRNCRREGRNKIQIWFCCHEQPTMIHKCSIYCLTTELHSCAAINNVYTISHSLNTFYLNTNQILYYVLLFKSSYFLSLIILNWPVCYNKYFIVFTYRSCVLDSTLTWYYSAFDLLSLSLVVVVSLVLLCVLRAENADIPAVGA